MSRPIGKVIVFSSAVRNACPRHITLMVTNSWKRGPVTLMSDGIT